MKTFHLLALIAGAAFGALVGCSSGGSKCSSAVCPAGCCDPNGVCQIGNTSNACGAGGSNCAVCSGNQVCQLGQCNGTTTGCNASNCAGCCTSSGTCILRANETVTQCGLTGASGTLCVACGTGQTCNTGLCVGGCNASTCTNGCCTNTGTCVPVASESTGQCGSNNQGGSSCIQCGTGQSCSGGVCTGGVPCTPQSCSLGCCTPSNTCVTFGNQGGPVCGTGGSACANCPNGDTCSAGVCTGGSCGPTNCQGCCDSNGFCPSGDTDLVCGTAGVACVQCGPGSHCVGGVCTGPDAGSGGDAGSGTDAGSGNDAGSGTDAGSTNDAGSGRDAGSSNDAGSTVTCGGVACNAGEVCCSNVTDAGAPALFCTANCPPVDIVTCGHPTDCGGARPICCLDSDMTGGTLPNCTLGDLSTTCVASCPKAFQLSCGPQHVQFTLCDHDSNCDAAAPKCCPFSIAGSALSVCLDTGLAGLIGCSGTP
jgi:hypothetical protein